MKGVVRESDTLLDSDEMNLLWCNNREKAEMISMKIANVLYPPLC